MPIALWRSSTICYLTLSFSSAAKVELTYCLITYTWCGAPFSRPRELGSAAGFVVCIYFTRARNMENNGLWARGWVSLQESELAVILISNTFYKGRIRNGNMSRLLSLLSLADAHECLSMVISSWLPSPSPKGTLWTDRALPVRGGPVGCWRTCQYPTENAENAGVLLETVMASQVFSR